MKFRRLIIIVSSIIIVFVMGLVITYLVLDSNLRANSVSVVQAEQDVFDVQYDELPAELEFISEEEYEAKSVEEESKDQTDEEFRQAIESEYLQVEEEDDKPFDPEGDRDPEGQDEAPGEDEDIYHRVEINDRIYSVLFMGDDARINQPRQRSDSIILISYNRDTHTVHLTSFMRDTLVPNSLTGGSWNRINRPYADGGPGKAINIMNYLFSLDIQRYVIINFSGVFELVDRLGGLDIELTGTEAKVISNIFPEYGKVTEGFNHLNGRQTLAYARMRKIDSDLYRTARQRNVLKTALLKVLETNNIDGFIALMNFALEYVETNIPLDEIITMGYEVFSQGKPEIAEFRVPIDNSYRHASYYGASVLVMDFPTNIRALHQFLFGNTDNVKNTNFGSPSSYGPKTTTKSSGGTEGGGENDATQDGGGGQDGGADGEPEEVFVTTTVPTTERVRTRTTTQPTTIDMIRQPENTGTTAPREPRSTTERRTRPTTTTATQSAPPATTAAAEEAQPVTAVIEQ
ncbi:MAG: LCP family protein [Oscillospiraceae bacterium]|nr:LCP family protein [Oscillospiraceae bacterium]